MEKIITLITTTANAQSDVNREITMHNLMWEITAVILVATLMYSIVQMLKNRMEYRLKNKIIDKGISEELASSLLHKVPNEGKSKDITQFGMYAGVIALLVVYWIPPVGLHSPALFTLVVYLGLLQGYNIFVRKGR